MGEQMQNKIIADQLILQIFSSCSEDRIIVITVVCRGDHVWQPSRDDIDNTLPWRHYNTLKKGMKLPERRLNVKAPITASAM